MDLGLQGKHAIVTGGSRGIGKAIARELAREGVDVAIVARNKEALEATARELAAETNRRILPLAADVTSKEQVDRMVAEAAQQLGGLHILVNSGSAPGGSATATGPIETRHRRGFDAGFQREVCRRAALLPRCHSVHEDRRAGAASSTSAVPTPATPAISAAAHATPPSCT